METGEDPRPLPLSASLCPLQSHTSVQIASSKCADAQQGASAAASP